MAKKKPKNHRNNYDSPWKNSIEKFFPEFMEYFFPITSATINWGVAPEFLNTEMHSILSATQDKQIYADKLVKVQQNDGKKNLLFVHVEVQAKPEHNFSYRMLQYNFRIHERYAQSQGCEVTSLAILADDNPNWRPGPYVRQSAESKLHFEFAVAKLLDMEVGNQELLQKGKNPFAWIVRAHLDSLATRKDTSDRFQRKKEVAQLLHEAGFSKSFVRETLVFCERILKLPREYDDPFKLHLEELEGKMGREYVPTWERQARSEGEQEKFSEVIARGLQKRLNGGSEPYIANIANLSETERNELFDLILDTTDVEKIKAWFEVHPVKKSSKKQSKN